MIFKTRAPSAVGKPRDGKMRLPKYGPSLGSLIMPTLLSPSRELPKPVANSWPSRAPLYRRPLGYRETRPSFSVNSEMSARMPKGRSVLLVEDEVMIRMMVADMLRELGHHLAAEAGRVGEAIELVQRTHFDIAILDVNLH